MTNQARHIYLKRIALLALMLSLTIIFCFVPISFGTVTLALMILPTLIVAQVSNFSTTITLALMMGLVNYIAWFTTKAATPLAPIFQNPLVCILPRVMIGVVSYFVRVGLEKLLLRKVNNTSQEVAENIGDDIPKNEETVEDSTVICGNANTSTDSDLPIATDSDSPPASDNESVLPFDDEPNIVEDEKTAVNNKKRFFKKGPYQQKALRDMSKKEILIRQIISVISTAMGVITNTALVSAFTLAFFNGTTIGQNTVIGVEYLLTWFGLNFAIEVVSFSLITPPIVLALKASRLA